MLLVFCPFLMQETSVSTNNTFKPFRLKKAICIQTWINEGDSNISPVQTRLMDTDLSIEVVGQAVLELTLDGVLLSEQGQVMAQFLMGGDDGALSVLIKLGTTRASENLHDVQNAQIHQCTALCIIDLSTLLWTQETESVQIFL